MLAPFKAIALDPALRAAAALLFLFGAFVCTIAPYQSLLAIQVFGLPNAAYAAVIVCASLVFVTASVGAGILTDRHLSRRLVAMVSVGAYLTGTASVWLVSGPISFVLAHALIMPLGSTIFAQCFALTRHAAATHPAATRPGIHATIRAIFALPFLLVLPIWSIAFDRGAPLLSVYPVLFGVSLCMSVVIVFFWPPNFFWPPDAVAAKQNRAPTLSFADALREFTAPGLMVRVGLLGILSGAVGLYMALIGLVFTAAGRSESEVALFVGLIAGAEIPFMLILPLMQQRLSKPALIVAGIVLYSCHLAMLPGLAATRFVWALILPASLGGAAILTLPIAYLQDLMANRPGAGSSLLAFQRVIGDVSVAVAFTLGTALSGYGLAALIGATSAVAAGLALWRIDGDRGQLHIP